MKPKLVRRAAGFATGVAMVFTTGPHAQPLAAAQFSFADKKVSDDSIHDLVMKRLADDADVKGGGLNVEVQDGVVTLRGKVETEKQKQKAEKLTKKVRGVKGVVNQITLSRG